MTPAATGEILTARLAELRLPATLERIVVGSRLTRYEFRPIGIARAGAIRRAREELALTVGEPRLSVAATISGHPGAFAIESPSEHHIVSWRTMPEAIAPLAFYAGLDEENRPKLIDIAAGPQWGVAGQTGAGKSMFGHVMVCSLASRFGPDEIRFLMIDPKQIELPRYNDLPHMFAPVANTVDSAINLLGNTLDFVELRLAAMQQFGARDLTEMNVKLLAAGRQPYPPCVLLIDEMADLMMASKKEVESLVVRIAQKSRAVGIHLVVSTQSPRIAVLTGLLKANLPSRICFSVASQTDSRVVIDRNGGELLLGKGDGLISMGGAEPVRFQSAFVTTDEIDAIVRKWR